MGFIMPRNAGLTEDVTRRMEDIVVVLLLPLFFAYTGLKTNIGLLDRPELWLLDAPNHALHVFDVSAAPRRLDDVRLERTLTTPGSLTESADGRYLYVGDAGDVIDTQKQESIANLPALQQAKAVLEVDWVDGHPVYPGFPR